MPSLLKAKKYDSSVTLDTIRSISDYLNYCEMGPFGTISFEDFLSINNYDIGQSMYHNIYSGLYKNMIEFYIQERNDNGRICRTIKELDCNNFITNLFLDNSERLHGTFSFEMSKENLKTVIAKIWETRDESFFRTDSVPVKTIQIISDVLKDTDFDKEVIIYSAF